MKKLSVSLIALLLFSIASGTNCYANTGNPPCIGGGGGEGGGDCTPGTPGGPGGPPETPAPENPPENTDPEEPTEPDCSDATVCTEGCPEYDEMGCTCGTDQCSSTDCPGYDEDECSDCGCDDNTESGSIITVSSGVMRQSFRVLVNGRSRGPVLVSRIKYGTDQILPEKAQLLSEGWYLTDTEFIVDEGKEGELQYFDEKGRPWLMKATDAGANNEVSYLPATGSYPKLIKKADGTFEMSSKRETVRKFTATDSNGVSRILEVRNDAGLVKTYTYSAEGRLTKITDPTKQYINIAYGTNGKVSEITLPNGFKKKFAYSTDGKLNRVELTEDIVYQFEYNDKDKISKKINPDNSEVTYEYQYNRIKKVTDETGNFYTIDMIDAEHIKHTDKMGRETHFWIIPEQPSLWTKKIDPLGRVVEKKYDENYRLIYQTDACGCGQGSNFTYDENGNLISQSDNLGNTESYVYENNKKIIYQDKRGNITKFTYYDDGKLRSMYWPDGSVITNEYITTADGGKLKSAMIVNYANDPNGRYISKKMEYNSDLQLIAQTEADGTKTTAGYDELGRKSYKITADTAIEGYEYDAMDKLYITIGPIGDINNDGVLNQDDLVAAKAQGIYTQEKFDFRGKVVESRDKNGNITKHEYNLDGRRVKTIYPDNSEVKYWYDAVGNKIKEQDQLGVYRFYEYDAEDQLIKEYDDNGTTVGEIDAEDSYVQYTYNERGQVIFRRDRMGNVTERQYDHGGKVIKEIDALGNYTEMAYDANGNVVSSRDKLGNVTTYEYDVRNNRTKTVNAENGVSTTVFCGNGKVISQTAPNGMVTVYEYDKMKRLTKQVVDAGTGRFNIATTYAYDNAGNMVAVVSDAGGLARTKTMQYDARGRLLKQVSADGIANTFTYDNNGNRLTAKTISSDESDILTQYYDYNNMNRIVRSVGIDGIVTTYEYDAAGQRILQTVDAEGQGALQIVGKSVYDTQGRMTQSIQDFNGLNATTQYTYNLNGNVVSQTDPTNTSTTFEYDSLSRRIKSTDELGNNMSIVYNAAGQTIEQVDANSRSTYTVYDKLGRVTKQLNEMNQPVEYTYDSVGNRLTLKDANGNVSTWTYDNLGRATSLTYPNGNVEQYAYNNLGQLISKTKPDGTVINYTYDNGGRPLTVGATTYTYDSLGWVLTESSPGGNVSYTYNDYGRLATVTDSNTGKTITYAYNRLGARSSMSVGGVQVTYGYDRLMNLTAVQKSGEATPTTYTYDLAGRRTALTTPNGVTTSYAYDNAGRLTSVQSLNAAQQTVSSFGYTLDPTGNRTAMSINLGGTVNTINYQFDNAYRLTRETRKDANNQTIFDEQLTYDNVGNRLGKLTWHADGNNVSTANTYNNANQLVTSVTGGVTTTYTYDANGNTVSIAEPNKTVTMSYDWLNRQTSWSDGTNTETQTYRGSSWKRVSTTVNGTQVKYLYDGDNVISDYDSNNVLTAFYVTPFLDQNISLTNAAGTSYYYTQDGLGSVRSLTNGSGAIVNKYDYTAFGEAYAGNTVEQLANRYTYTGREKSSLSSAGVAGGIRPPMYYRWRSYSPSIGRFLWRDPIGYADGVNIYAYVNNPIISIDSNGTSKYYASARLIDTDFWLSDMVVGRISLGPSWSCADDGTLSLDDDGTSGGASTNSVNGKKGWVKVTGDFSNSYWSGVGTATGVGAASGATIGLGVGAVIGSGAAGVGALPGAGAGAGIGGAIGGGIGLIGGLIGSRSFSGKASLKQSASCECNGNGYWSVKRSEIEFNQISVNSASWKH